MIERMCPQCGRSSAIRPCQWCAKAWKKHLTDMQKREKMKRSNIKRGNDMNNFKINDRVIRVLGDSSTLGDKGTVVEINEAAGRVRIIWDPPKDKRTWMQFKAVQVEK